MLKDFFIETFGEYNPITYEACEFQTICDAEGYCDVDTICNDVIPSGVAGVDWVYVFPVISFLIVLLSLCKMLGGLICNRL